MIVADLIKELEEFRNLREQQKQRGLNDFNIITIILNYHDEVRVHSRMIGELLDINGKHFQKTLFLDKFINRIGIDNYDTKKSELHLEQKHIDLYLTDGVNHIIIENKIWADDQEKQIKRYIDIIKEENKDIDKNNLYTVYLSLDRNEPTKYSLDTYKIENNYVVNSDNIPISKFININYKDKILDWLEDCKYEVQNITNLNESIKQYIDVVKMVTNQYKSLISKYEDFFLNQERYECYEKNKNKVLNGLEDINSIDKGFDETKQKLYDDFYKNIVQPIIDNNSYLSYFQYAKNSTIQKIELTLKKYYSINLFFNKQHTKLIAITVGIAWTYNKQGKNDKVLKNELETHNNKLQQNRKLDYIRNDRGYIFNPTYSILNSSLENLFLVQNSKIEPLSGDIVDDIQKHINIIVDALK